MFRDVSEALSWGKFDAAVLMVPHDLHESLTLQCSAAGKHVLLEKPLAHSLESCVRLVEAAEVASTIVMVAENSVYWPEVSCTHTHNCVRRSWVSPYVGGEGEGTAGVWSSGKDLLCTGQLLGEPGPVSELGRRGEGDDACGPPAIYTS